MEDAKALMQEGVARWNAHDRDALLALYDEAISFVDEPTGRRLDGREEVGKGFYDVWMEAYPDNRLEDAVVFAEGDLACLQARFVGTNTGPMREPGFEMAATGKAIDAPFVMIAEAHNGTVKRLWHYYDRLLAFEQEGIVRLDQLLVSAAARV